MKAVKTNWVNERKIISKKGLFFLFVLSLFLVYSQNRAQVIYDFGTNGGTLSTNNTYGQNPAQFNNFPTSPSAIRLFYGLSASAGAKIKASNPGLKSVGTNTELQANAGGIGEFNKIGVYGYSASGTLFSYLKYDLSFAGDSLALTTADNGTWYFLIGDGGTSSKFMYDNLLPLNTNNCGVALRWNFTTNGGLTFQRFDYTQSSGNEWITVTNFVWTQKKKYTVEIYANVNKNSSGYYIYTRAGIKDTLAPKTMDIYVNNQIICHQVNVSHPDNTPSVSDFSKMDSYCWYGTGSNNAWIFVDNSVAGDVAPTTYSYYTIKPANGTTLDLSQLSSWTTSSNGIGGTSPANFSIANCTWFIRNYNGSTGISFTLSSGNLNVTGGTNSQIEIGDSGQVATVTIPAGKSILGDLDIRGKGDLLIQSTTLPTIRTTDSNSTVQYYNGDADILYPLYYNLKILGGTKTINSDYIVEGAATIGNGTNSTTLIIPPNFKLNGYVDIRNNGKLKIQNNNNYAVLGTLETGSTVEYNGTSQQSLQPGKIYHNLIVNNPGGVLISENNTVNGTLTLTNGNFTINGKTLTIAGNINCNGGKLIAGNTGSMAPDGSNIFITGTGDAGTISFLPGYNVISDFTMDRTSNGKITLASCMQVAGTLTLSNGLILCNTTNDSITLGTSTSSPGTLVYNQNQNFTTWISGKFQRYIPVGAGNNSDNAILFPVGSPVKWAGVKLIFDASNGTTSAGTLSAMFKQWDGGSLNTTFIDDNGYIVNVYSRHAFWTIKNNSVSGTYEINIDASNFPGLNNNPDSTLKRQNLRILKREDSLHAWTVQGVHTPGNGDITRWTAKRTGLTTFSDFTLGSYSLDNDLGGNNPLPVKLKTFTFSVASRNVNLIWITESEINNSGFEIQRCKTDIGKTQYEKIGFIESKGNSNTNIIYRFSDNNLNSGTYKYRLKQIDNNGNYEYYELSENILIAAPKKFELGQNYPNPFNPTTRIDFSLPFDSKVKIVLYDNTGREIRIIINEYRTAGYYTETINASDLSSGVYFIRFISGEFTGTRKVLLLK